MITPIDPTPWVPPANPTEKPGMSPIAKALHRQTPAERLATGIYTNSFPRVANEYAMLMLRFALYLDAGVAPAGVKGGAT